MHSGTTPDTRNSFKYFRRWTKSLRDKNRILPWMTYQAIDALSSHLKPGSRVFEYGGGGSTTFFLDKKCDVVTVEHDEQWFAQLKQNHSRHWEGHLVVASPGLLADTPDPANPNHYFSDDENFRNSNFKHYASFIDKYDDGSFDAVIVDGRARPSCMMHAVSKVKRGGLLLLDNTERVYYWKMLPASLKEFDKILDCYGPVPYTNWFNRTTIWKRK